MIENKYVACKNLVPSVYNHGLFFNIAPYEIIEDEKFIKSNLKLSKALLCSYIKKFDISEETDWYYVVKDDIFILDSLKSKLRYEISKGIKNFTFKKIDPLEFNDEIYKIDFIKFKDYPKQYKPKMKEDSTNYIESNNTDDYFGIFSNETSSLIGYARCGIQGKSINLYVVSIISDYFKLGASAALINGVLEYYKDWICKGYFMCDGSKNIRHQTNFQEYLIKYFNFRKAYCNMKIIYKFPIKYLLFFLKPFKSLFKKSQNALFYNVGCVLELDKCSDSSMRRKGK